MKQIILAAMLVGGLFGAAPALSEPETEVKECEAIFTAGKRPVVVKCENKEVVCYLIGNQGTCEQKTKKESK